MRQYFRQQESSSHLGRCVLGLFILVAILVPVGASAKGGPATGGNYPLPLVSFQVEDEQGLVIAKRCLDIWELEGPAMVEELWHPAKATPDTIVCLILDTASFQEYFQGRAPDWGVGIAIPPGDVIALDYSRLSGGGRGVREVFLHEMTHALLFKASEGIWLPTWFHEGVAMHFSGEWRFVDTVSLMLEGRVPDLYALQGRFPQSAVTADQAYRTSLLAINKLRTTYGPGILSDLVAASVQEGGFSTGFQTATGTGLNAFISDFSASMRLRFGWLIMLTRWPTLFVILALILAVGATRKILNTRRRLAAMEDDEDENENEVFPE